MSLICESCAAAENDPLSGLYHAECGECKARMLAHGMPFTQSSVKGNFTEAYRAQLHAAFGPGWEAGHRAVKRWARRIDEAMAKENAQCR
jgi:hypothetical protein